MTEPAKPLRQQIDIPIGEKRYVVDVTFRILEIVERYYSEVHGVAVRADAVFYLLQDDASIRRIDVATVIANWLAAERVDHDRAEVYEAVITADTDRLRVYVGCIVGAIGYSMKRITLEDLKRAAAGEDVDDGKKKTTTEAS